MFRTVESFLSREEWNNELVFVFGKGAVDRAIPSEYVISIPNSKFVKPEKLCARIEPTLFQHGLIFVADEAVGIQDGEALQRLQMVAIASYYQNHYFGSFTRTAPCKAVRFVMGGIMDPSRNISQMYNMPWLLRYPLADKLVQKSFGLPVLILLPGPGFHAIKPHLKQLAQRFIIVCIARSLQNCLDAGVEPDFVVQYDTHLEQKFFYESVPRLEKTVLVSLSSANLSEFAWKFRGIFFRASFNKSILKNTYMLRDSTESSLLACMGLAEALRAPVAMIAGANLSWSKDDGQYFSENGPVKISETLSNDYRILGEGDELYVVGRNGKQAMTNVGYIAAAERAAEFAREIKEAAGTQFHLTADEGIMLSSEFPLAPVETMLEMPVIDRDAFVEKLDEALSAKEDLDLEGGLQALMKKANFLKLQELNFKIRTHQPEFTFELYNDLVALMDNVRSFVMPTLKSDVLVANFISRWAQAQQYGLKCALAHVLARSQRLPVLCTEDEYELIKDNIDSFFPQEKVKLLVITCMSYHEQSKHEFLEDYNMGGWLEAQPMMFVSQGMLSRYRFVFDTLGDDTIIPLPAFT